MSMFTHPSCADPLTRSSGIGTKGQALWADRAKAAHLQNRLQSPDASKDKLFQNLSAFRGEPVNETCEKIRTSECACLRLAVHRLTLP